MKIYSSTAYTKEEFVPHKPGRVSMCTCGPTVYHSVRTGNLCSYIMEGVPGRLLRYVGCDVTRVMSITDVGHLTFDADTGEDKMLKRAQWERKTVMEIAQFYTDAFFTDCKRLNIKYLDVVQSTTGMIGNYIKVISSLIDRSYVCFAGSNVYFDTSKLEKYYIFNDYDEEDLAVGVREGVKKDANKRNKNDFVLWFTKFKLEDQALKWDSPWGVGYLGWHVKCSCTSMKYPEEHLGIHCGGTDSTSPHHTNEIAQSEAYLGHPWCKYWVHIRHLDTNSDKMSKSRGESLTVSLLEEKGYDPLVYRFFCPQSRYRKGLVFFRENLDSAKAACDKLMARVAALNSEGTVDEEAVGRFKNDFLEATGNDLSTPLGVTVLYDVLKAGVSDVAKRATLDSFDQILNLESLSHANAPRAQQATPVEGAEEIEALTAKHLEAKRTKNWAEAGVTHDQLRAVGMEIKDGKDDTTRTRI